MDFEYTTFWHWFRGGGGTEHALVPTDDVIVYAYHLAPHGLQAQRSGDRGEAAPFVRGRVQAFRVREGDALFARDRQLFEHGAYAVLDSDALLKPNPPTASPEDQRRRDAALSKKRLYVVAPTWVPERRVMMADHFTFVVNHPKPAKQTHAGAAERSSSENRDRKPLKLHFTEYLHSASTMIFRRGETKNYLPLRFHLGDYAHFQRTQLQPAFRQGALGPALHDLLTRPYGSTVVAGGARRRKQAPPRGRNRAAEAAERLEEAGSPRTFADLWRVLPLQQLVMFGVRRGAHVHFTVDALPRVPHVPGTLTPAAAFQLSIEDAGDEDRVREAATHAMADWHWEDFVLGGDDL